MKYYHSFHTTAKNELDHNVKAGQIFPLIEWHINYCIHYANQLLYKHYLKGRYKIRWRHYSLRLSPVSFHLWEKDNLIKQHAHVLYPCKRHAPISFPI